uniref:Uncharacterized protein n=1 Tax=Ditylenchus dipsaci TaxID=166011 RepID=A0A915DGK3_9BILA
MAFVYADQNEPLEGEEEFQVHSQRLELERIDPLSLFRHKDARVKRIFCISIAQLRVLATISSPRHRSDHGGVDPSAFKSYDLASVFLWSRLPIARRTLS